MAGPSECPFTSAFHRKLWHNALDLVHSGSCAELEQVFMLSVAGVIQMSVGRPGQVWPRSFDVDKVLKFKLLFNILYRYKASLFERVKASAWKELAPYGRARNPCQPTVSCALWTPFGALVFTALERRRAATPRKKQEEKLMSAITKGLCFVQQHSSTNINPVITVLTSTFPRMITWMTHGCSLRLIRLMYKIGFLSPADLRRISKIVPADSKEILEYFQDDSMETRRLAITYLKTREFVEKGAANPVSLRQLCLQNVSRQVGCHDDRAARVQRLDCLPNDLKPEILFEDVLGEFKTGITTEFLKLKDPPGLRYCLMKEDEFVFP